MSDNPLLFLAAAAAFSSASKALIDAPLDRIKLLLQLQPGVSQLYPNNRYKGIFNCTTRVYKEQGFLSYWRGATPAILESMLKKLWMLSMNDFLSAKPQNRNHGITKNFIIGGLSGLSHLIITYPLDLLRTKLAVDVGGNLAEREYKSMNDCANKIWKADGIRGFYRGVWLPIPGVFIYRGMYFGLYNSAKYVVDTTNYILMFFVAQLIVTVSGLAAYPIDTIKRRMMIQSGKISNNIQQPIEEKFKNSFVCAYKMLRKEGLRSFYGGWWVNFFRGLGGAAALVGYDMIMPRGLSKK